MELGFRGRATVARPHDSWSAQASRSRTCTGVRRQVQPGRQDLPRAGDPTDNQLAKEHRGPTPSRQIARNASPEQRSFILGTAQRLVKYCVLIVEILTTKRAGWPGDQRLPILIAGITISSSPRGWLVWHLENSNALDGPLVTVFSRGSGVRCPAPSEAVGWLGESPRSCVSSERFRVTVHAVILPLGPERA
jgi:hypothetical protein